MFDSNLEAKGSKPILKEKSVVRMVELKEVYDLIYAVSGELETYLRRNYEKFIHGMKREKNSQNSF